NVSKGSTRLPSSGRLRSEMKEGEWLYARWLNYADPPPNRARPQLAPGHHRPAPPRASTAPVGWVPALPLRDRDTVLRPLLRALGATSIDFTGRVGVARRASVARGVGEPGLRAFQRRLGPGAIDLVDPFRGVRQHRG